MLMANDRRWRQIEVPFACWRLSTQCMDALIELRGLANQLHRLPPTGAAIHLVHQSLVLSCELLNAA